MEFSKWPYICEKFDQIINTILKGFPIDPVKYLFALISTLKHSAFDKLQIIYFSWCKNLEPRIFKSQCFHSHR